jgi:uncharacterized protein
MITASWPRLAPFLMLGASNVFMTFAWYGHLKYRHVALPLAVLASWGIAFFEYSLAVPANRIGVSVYTVAELKTIQEAITLVVFALFSVFYLGETLKLTTIIGFGFILVGAAFVFMNR